MYYHYGAEERLGWGHMVVGGIMMVLFWGLVIWAIVWAFRAFSGSRRIDEPTSMAPVTAAREILDKRFVKGEIAEDEYKRMRAVLEGRDTTD